MGYHFIEKKSSNQWGYFNWSSFSVTNCHMFVKLLVFLGSPFFVGSIDTHSSLVPSYPLHGIVQFVVNKHYVTIINFIASKKMGWCIPIKSMKSHEITQPLGCLFTSHPLPRARKARRLSATCQGGRLPRSMGMKPDWDQTTKKLAFKPSTLRI